MRMVSFTSVRSLDVDDDGDEAFRSEEDDTVGYSYSKPQEKEDARLGNSS